MCNSACILIVCLCIFIMPAGTLRLPWLRFFRAFSSVVRQMPGYNSQRRGTARTLPKMFVLFVLFVLCHSVYCLCVNVYCTTATWWQPNYSLTNISYHILHTACKVVHFYQTIPGSSSQKTVISRVTTMITWNVTMFFFTGSEEVWERCWVTRESRKIL